MGAMGVEGHGARGAMGGVGGAGRGTYSRFRVRAEVIGAVSFEILRPKPFPEPLMLLMLAPRVPKEKRSLDDAHPGPPPGRAS